VHSSPSILGFGSRAHSEMLLEADIHQYWALQQ
jgi:hypothetical protein